MSQISKIFLMKDSHLADDCFPFCTHSQTRGCKAFGQRSERHSRRIQKLSPIMNGIFLRIPKHLQRRGIKWFSLGAVKSPLLVLQTAVQRLGIRPASELIIKTGLLGSNLIVLPTSLLRLLAHFNNCFTCERLSTLTGWVHPKLKIQSSSSDPHDDGKSD